MAAGPSDLTERRALVDEAAAELGAPAVAAGAYLADRTDLRRGFDDAVEALGVKVNAIAPGYVKGAVVFLTSAASDYAHGVVLPVDEGWLSR